MLASCYSDLLALVGCEQGKQTLAGMNSLMAPPNFRVSIFKRFSNEVWSNDWLLNVLDMENANTVATALVEFERRMHHADVIFEYMRISTLALADRIFRHIPINLPGYSASALGSYMPLYCTLRLDMSTVDSDPCRKYFRQPVVEQNQADGKFTTAAIDVYNGFITTYLVNTIALDNIVSSRGNVVTGATINPYVQMRQLTRRKRPKIPPA